MSNMVIHSYEVYQLWIIGNATNINLLLKAKLGTGFMANHHRR